VTAPEILFFWVARMVMAGNEFCGQQPFSNVYLTGTVRDKQGRKMSKSLGNSPDPLKLIENFGADGVRVGMLLCSSAGNDILFDESQVEQGRNFSNKIWNAFRLVKGWSVCDEGEMSDQSVVAVKWFDSLLSSSVEIINDHFSKFRLSDALMHLYKLFWDDFCSLYLELIKPPYGKDIDKTTYGITLDFFDKLLRLLHPFMPFITEELWQSLCLRDDGESIMIASLPKSDKIDREILDQFEIARNVVVNVRNIRQAKGISPKNSLTIFTKGIMAEMVYPVIHKLANVDSIKKMSEKSPDSSGSSFMVGTTEFFVPLEGFVDREEELGKALAELKHLEGFLSGVKAKLSNDKFMANAPDKVVAMEEKKKSDAETKIYKLQQLIEHLKR
jgi:valyl-tRNA synthetase